MYLLHCFYLCFLPIASKARVTTPALTEECQVICMCALGKLQDVCKRICRGNISMSELEEIKERKGQMDKLCRAAATDSDVPSVRVLNDNIIQRQKEFRYFQLYHQQLDNLTAHLSSMQVQGTQFVYRVVSSRSCIYSSRWCPALQTAQG